MKALISAFALLSFVAASTIPVVAQAQSPNTETTMPKKATKKKHARKVVSHKKKMDSKMKKPNAA